ncbi:transglycosylase SLT domain-containing protein [Coralliovum pocilloporae]|uniref:lytic transglycosylase domain-containing protein n=1 Tax=Coralliovum pocilloporae TaxID=3066369 RepID=UPI0033076BD2
MKEKGHGPASPLPVTDDTMTLKQKRPGIFGKTGTLAYLISMTCLVSTGLAVPVSATPVPEPRPQASSPVSSPERRTPAIRFGSVPTPAPRPQNSYAPARTTPLAVKPTGSAKALGKALTALDRGKPQQARALRTTLSSRLDREILDWQIILTKGSGASSNQIQQFERQYPNWPGDDIRQVRLELALWEEKASARKVLSAFSGRTPKTITGRYIYARALLNNGQKSKAAVEIRKLWHRETLWSALEGRILADFRSVLTKQDHKIRVHFLLYRDRTTAAARLKRFLSSSEKALVDARTAVSKKQRKAAKLLQQVPRSQHSDPLYLFSRIQHMRRANKITKAAQLMLKAPTKQSSLIHPDEWWVERKLIARKLLDQRDYKTAYRIAAGHSAESEASQVEAEFHAGWIALSYLNNPRQAYPHFERVLALATTDRTSARAYYWMGRAQQVSGNTSAARQLYERAGQFGNVFYGQLAREALGKRNTGLLPVPKLTQTARRQFEQRKTVIMARRLHQAGHSSRTGSIIRHMAKQAKSREELAQIIALAEDLGEHQYALQAALLAGKNGINPGMLAFPINAIPKSTRIPSRVGKALVYAIARQESAFNIGAVSSANARGLLQLLPSTAKATAKRNGLPYSKSRLTTDARYNATVGAAHLGELLDEFQGSYSLVAVGYNAGKRRSYQWTERFGDPRSSSIDIVDWVERIPFTETRKYVQRVLENMQVYKARLDGAPLTLTRDLKRGR